MKKCFFVGLVLIAIVALLLEACAPQAAPAPKAQPSSPSTPIPTTSVPPPASQQDAAWAKVVDAAKAEGKLTLYSFWLTGDTGKVITQAFQQKYGIDVEIVGGVGSVLIERIKTEQAARKNTADTLDGSPGLAAIAMQGGILAPVGDLPVLREQNVWYIPPRLDPQGLVLSAGVGVICPWINTTIVKPGDEPHSYKDLLDPRWKGKMVVSSPLSAPSFNYIYAAFVPQGTLDTDYFRKFGKQDLKIAPDVRQDVSMVMTGEVALTVASADSIVGPFILQGAPLKALEMVEGVLVNPTPAISLVKDAPHPNAARLFISWLLSPEGQTAFHKAKGSTPIRKDVPSFLPPSARLEMKRTVALDINKQLDAAKLQTEGTVAKLIGVEK